MKSENQKETNLYLGSHVSMKSPDYLLGSVRESLEYGSTACMIFTGPPRNSIRKPIEALRIEEARSLLESQPWDFEQIVVHAPYIINLANGKDEQVRSRSIDLLRTELERTAALGCRYLVLHPGSRLGLESEKAIALVSQGLDEILENDSSRVQIALETMAGKGGELGRNFDELAAIIDGSRYPERLCVCMDTCHMHDAGFDLDSFDAILKEFDAKIGLEKLRVLHINNSKNERGSKKDRHENLAYGTISVNTLAAIVHHPALRDAVKILETPYRQEQPIYAEEIELLRSMADKGEEF